MAINFDTLTSNIGDYLSGAGLSEEEKKRRELEAQREAEVQRINAQQLSVEQGNPVKPVQPQPIQQVTPTITQQPTAGQGAPEPQTQQSQQQVTPMAPVQPQPMVNATQVQQTAAGAPQSQPQGPVNPEVVNEVNQTQLPQPGAGVQVAGATQMPPQQTQPQPVDKNQYTVNANYGMEGQQPGLQLPTPSQPTASAQHVQQYQAAQTDPLQLLKLAQQPTTPDWMKERANNRAADLLMHEKERNKIMQELPTMSETEFEKRMREKTTGGSIFKAIGYGLMGMTSAAQAEAAKLGMGTDQAVQGPDGKAYLIKVAKNGTPLEGFSAETGKKLKPDELITVAAGVNAQKGAQTHTGKMQDMTTGEVYYERTTPQGIQLVDNNGKRYTGSTANLRPFGIGSDIQTKNQIQINELQNKLAFAGPTASATERAKVIAESEAKYGPLDPAFKASVMSGQPRVTGTVPVQQTQAPRTPATTQPNIQPNAQPNVARPVTPQQAAGAVVTPAPQPTITQQPITTTTPAIAGQTPAEREVNKELAVTEKKPAAEAKGKNEAQDINNQRFADEAYTSIRPIAELVKKSTGSGLGAKVDTLAAFFGKGTEGAQAIAELEPLVYPLVANVPRFQGSQSDYDVKMYQKAAGDFANAEKPVKTRLAALQGMISLLKKYDKEGKNDWSFSGESPASTSGIRIINRERVQ